MNLEIVHLNVGGTRFSTSRQTLAWVQDSFFSSILSGRIPTTHDEQGAIFIDRDPALFSKILNYLRTKHLDLQNVDIHIFQHEAEFYGITPLVQRLLLCHQLDDSTCGGILFQGLIPAPPVLDESLPAIRKESEESHDPSCHACHCTLWHSSSKLTCAVLSSKLNVKSSLSQIHTLKGHFNWLVAAFPHFVALYRLKDSTGWQRTWTSPWSEQAVDKIAINAKLSTNMPEYSRMVAASFKNDIQLWCISDEGIAMQIGTFNMTTPPDHLIFIGSQLVALSALGKVGVWNAVTKNWQIQDVAPITSHDTAGTFLLLGCNNGSIYYIDMQKFPLRMKDNDLLVTELYKDPAGEAVIALSVYLTSKTSLSGNWIEIAYGTNEGTVNVIVQHPETVGQGPQLFQTFTVHRSPICSVALSEKHLISVCSEYNHVRSWSVTRFRGMISTQPGSMSLASFKVVSLQGIDSPHSANYYIGPFGEKDDEQIFIQKVVPETNKLFVRLASNGSRVCVIKSVDDSFISSIFVHECEGSNRIGSQPRRHLFTGHSNGSIQIWDLSTALKKQEEMEGGGGPSTAELVQQLDSCSLSSSCNATPVLTPASSAHIPQFSPLPTRLFQ